MNGLSPADISGRRSTAEPRMAKAITLLTTESLAIIARGSPVRKLTAMPARLTASISTASRFSAMLARAATRAFDLLEPSLGSYGIQAQPGSQ